MKTLKFKTNVKCGACVATITPAMNELNLEKWEVDLQDPNRILSVEGEVDKEKVKAALKKSGYQGESI